MRQIVGVESWTVILGIFNIAKRDALFFDKIAIPYLNTFLEFPEKLQGSKPEWFNFFQERFSIEECFQEVRRLQETGFIFETTHQFDSQKLVANIDFQQIVSQLIMFIPLLQETFQKGGTRTLLRFLRQVKQQKQLSILTVDSKVKDLFEQVMFVLDQATRLFAIQLRELENFEAYPVLIQEIKVSNESEAKKTDVIQITLNAFPLIDENTSWEQILDFRNDEDSRQKFIDLRNWMNETARAKLTPIEVEQKLEYLIQQYKKQLELHKIKTNTGIFETTIVSLAEIAESLVKFQFSKIAKLAFSFKHRKISLIEGEQNTKGSEVGYIIKAVDKF